MDSDTQLNRVHWDELARRHGQDGWYDVTAFLAGAGTLNDHVEDALQRAVQTLTGAEVLHLQCHFGLDTLSLARRGARVTGLDFSPVAVDRAVALARRARLDATFVCADVLDPPASLTGGFDVVFASYGVLCWVPSAAAWMRSAARCLRSGGVVVLVEIHPLVTMIDSLTPLVVDFPYGAEMPKHFSSATSYAADDLPAESQETVQWPHGLGEVVTAAAAAGLIVEELVEWLDEPRDSRLVAGDDGRCRLPFGDQYLPVTYALRARKP